MCRNLPKVDGGSRKKKSYKRDFENLDLIPLAVVNFSCSRKFFSVTFIPTLLVYEVFC